MNPPLALCRFRSYYLRSCEVRAKSTRTIKKLKLSIVDSSSSLSNELKIRFTSNDHNGLSPVSRTAKNEKIYFVENQNIVRTGTALSTYSLR